MNHATSSNLYRSYYPHRLRDSMSPVCGDFLYDNLSSYPGKKTQQKNKIKKIRKMGRLTRPRVHATAPRMGNGRSAPTPHF